MLYEINVSLNGVHFFATSARSITDKMKLGMVYIKFCEAFKPEDGYVIDVLEVCTSRRDVDIKALFGGRQSYLKR